MNRRMLGNITLLLASLCVTTVLFEVGLRFFYRVGSTPMAHKTPDPMLGWRLQPNAKYSFQKLDFRATVSHNSKGWRDLERDHAKPAGGFRIVTLGDSYLEGYTVNDEDVLHRQVEKIARDAGHDVEVVNLAVGGFGTLQEYLAFETYGKSQSGKFMKERNSARASAA